MFIAFRSFVYHASGSPIPYPLVLSVFVIAFVGHYIQGKLEVKENTLMNHSLQDRDSEYHF